MSFDDAQSMSFVDEQLMNFDTQLPSLLRAITFPADTILRAAPFPVLGSWVCLGVQQCFHQFCMAP